MTAPVRLPPPEAIQNELARRSFALWSERRFHIRDKRGVDVMLRLNPVQRAIDAAEEEQIARHGEARLYVLKGRQGGVTTAQQAKALHQVMTTDGIDALTLAHDRDATDRIFTKITRVAIEKFPPEHLPTLGNRQTREIEVVDRGSRFYTGTAGGGSGKSSRTGRGLTLRRLHGSEFAFWDTPKETLNSVTGGLVPDGSVVVLETTASGYGTDAHKFWQEARDGRNSYRALFFPWWDCDPVNYRRHVEHPSEMGKLEDDEKALIRRFRLSLPQIAWRRHMIRDMGGRDEFFQEYPEDDESCWLAPGGNYYPIEDLRALQVRAAEPTSTVLALGDPVEIFDEPRGERVIIGADTAEGVQQDRSTFVARAFPSWRLLRTYASASVQPKEFAGILNEQGRALGGAFLVVEKNMHGITVLRHLRDDHRYPVGSIYHRTPLDQSTPNLSARIGWATTAESLPIMLGAGRELLGAAKEGNASVPPASVIRDAFTVRRGDNGKFSLTGRDMLVAEMLAWIGRSAPTETGMLDWLKAEAERLKPPDSPTA